MQKELRNQCWPSELFTRRIIWYLAYLCSVPVLGNRSGLRQELIQSSTDTLEQTETDNKFHRQRDEFAGVVENKNNANTGNKQNAEGRNGRSWSRCVVAWTDRLYNQQRWLTVPGMLQGLGYAVRSSRLSTNGYYNVNNYITYFSWVKNLLLQSLFLLIYGVFGHKLQNSVQIQ